MGDTQADRFTGDAALKAEREKLHDGDAPADLAALCLSGGGIRSAAFGLGVLQGLAELRVLDRFHYLSTVSGGGYIGAWLSARIARHGLEKAQADLSDPAVVAQLRRASNFLTPQTGAFSADTWTAGTIYLRNLLLVWASLLPFFLLVSLGAVFYRTSLAIIAEQHVAWSAAILVVATCCLAYAIGRASTMLPSHRIAPDGFLPSAGVQYLVLLAMVWGLLVPLVVATGFSRPGQAPARGALSFWLDAIVPGMAATAEWAPLAIGLAVVYLVAVVGGYLVAWLQAEKTRELYRTHCRDWLIASLAGAVFVALGVKLLHAANLADRNTVLVVMGTPWLVLGMVLHTGVFIGLRREQARAELDREWTARFSALMLQFGLVVVVVTFCCLSLSKLVLHDLRNSNEFWLAVLVPVLTGPLAAWVGKLVISQATAAARGDADKLAKTIDIGLPVLAALFAAGLLAGLTYALEYWALRPLQNFLVHLQCGSGSAAPPGCGPVQANGTRLPDAGLMLLAQGLLLVGLGVYVWFIRLDVNRFSLHNLYRNRLTRGFLANGTAADADSRDPFTGFCDKDDVALARRLETSARKLFPVINIAVNLTSTGNAAWAERKALSFTATPLHCGYFVPGETTHEPCYVETANYAWRERENNGATAGKDRGFTIGEAMTISGAAASPHWGYQSSPVTAFLMSLFNVRLGAWVPNPAKATDAEMAMTGPRWHELALLNDLLGRTDIESQAVYLSDGGHFENLGLYEMLRRKCRLILVVDAGEDGDCSFEDLGNAVRKAAIDLSVTVKLETPRIAKRAEAMKDALGFGVGRIDYDKATSGWLVYIKPSWLDDMPIDVRAYGNLNKAFPHESTTDQWFSESQFESYRHLGAEQLRRTAGACEDDLHQLFRNAFNAYPSAGQPPVL